MSAASRSGAHLVMALAMLLGACAPRLQPAGPTAALSAAPQLADDQVTTADGTVLPMRIFRPTAPPRGAIVALHGFNDYANAFAGIGAFLAERGYIVYAYDQRGFGGAPQPGLWPGSRRLIDDFRDVLAIVQTRHRALPVYTLGESMGGAVLLAAWAERPFDAAGIVLVGPAVWGRQTMELHQIVVLWLGAHTLPWVQFTGRGLGIKPSDNVEMLHALSRDPLVIKETRVDAMWGIANLMDRAAVAAARFDGPALLLYGANDEIIPPRAARAMIDRLPPVPADLRRIAVYPDGYHMLLRDLQAQTVWRDVLAWLDDPRTPLPSGADNGDPLRSLPR